MRRRPRLRRVAKWGGTATCLLFLVAFAVSGTGEYAWIGQQNVPPGSEHLMWGFALTRGQVVACIIRRRDYLVSGWQWRIAPRDRWRWLGPYEYRLGPDFAVQVPVWIPLTLVLLPTAFLWYRDRRPPPGHCPKCGYDLTANESGRCPECGTEVLQEQHDASET
jgi:hypothetical protein